MAANSPRGFREHGLDLTGCVLAGISLDLTREEQADKDHKLGYMLTVTGDIHLFSPGEEEAIIPFAAAKTFLLYTPPGTTATAEIYTAECEVFSGGPQWQVGIKIAVIVQVAVNACLSLPAKFWQAVEFKPENIQTSIVISSCTIKMGLCLECSAQPLQAETYQYSAIAAPDQSVYTNADEIPQFGSQGIPDPETVSWAELFINGGLQPPANYTLQSGALTLLTDDLPLPGSPIVLRFIAVKAADSTLLPADCYQFCTVSDGNKLVFVNADEIPAYGSDGIPDPALVSYFNLFVNGVLQPTTNYQVAAGTLTLTTDSPPIPGAPITLQAITIPGDNGPLPALVDIFNAQVAGSLYTDQDGIPEYSSSNISDPNSVSFSLLAINGVAQPQANYSLELGKLTLLSDPLPLAGGPISLQYVRILAANCG